MTQLLLMLLTGVSYAGTLALGILMGARLAAGRLSGRPLYVPNVQRGATKSPEELLRQAEASLVNPFFNRDSFYSKPQAIDPKLDEVRQKAMNEILKPLSAGEANVFQKSVKR